ncbi:hypothetical protein QYF61_003788, partial [Mycteria americana]
MRNGFVELLKRKLGGDLTAVYDCLMGGYREGRARLCCSQTGCRQNSPLEEEQQGGQAVIDKHMWATEKVSIGGLPSRQPAENCASGEATPVRIRKSHRKENERKVVKHWNRLPREVVESPSLEVLLEGVCEIWLTSEDTGAYGRDIGTDLPTLLWKLVEAIPEGAMLRLGMTNPPYILEHLEVLEGCYKVSPEPSLLQAEQPQLSQPVFKAEVLQLSDHLRGSCQDLLQQAHVLLMLGAPELNAVLQEMAKILNHPRVYAFLHIPVQSASDSVLMDMKREYCVADFKQVVDFLKEKCDQKDRDDISRAYHGSENVIPHKEKPRANENRKLITNGYLWQLYIHFESAVEVGEGNYANKFIRGPKRRCSFAFNELHCLLLKVGERQRVLVTEESFDSNYYVAHNPFYEQVLVPKDPLLMGKMVEVNIYEAGKHFMKGQPVSDARVYTASITRPLAKGEVSGLTEEFRRAPQNGTNWKAQPSAEIPVKTPLSSWMALQLPWQQEGGGLKILSVSLALLAVLVMFYYAKAFKATKSFLVKQLIWTFRQNPNCMLLEAAVKGHWETSRQHNVLVASQEALCIWDHAEVSMGWGALENRNSSGAEEEKLLETLFLKAENQVPGIQLNIDVTDYHVHSVLINHSTNELPRYTVPAGAYTPGLQAQSLEHPYCLNILCSGRECFGIGTVTLFRPALDNRASVAKMTESCGDAASGDAASAALQRKQRAGHTMPVPPCLLPHVCPFEELRKHPSSTQGHPRCMLHGVPLTLGSNAGTHWYLARTTSTLHPPHPTRHPSAVPLEGANFNTYKVWSLDLVEKTGRTPHSSPAPAWGPSHSRQFSMNFSSVSSSHGLQSSMNFSNVSPSHGLQFFMNCSSVGPFHGVQSFRNRLLQRGSPTGSQVLPANLLQRGLLSPQVHRSCQEPAPARASHGVTASFGHPPAPGLGSSTGCREDETKDPEGEVTLAWGCSAGEGGPRKMLQEGGTTEDAPRGRPQAEERSHRAVKQHWRRQEMFDSGAGREERKKEGCAKPRIPM